MTNYRGLLWSLVAIAGTATAAAVVYRYATRSVRPSEDDDAAASTRPGGAADGQATRDEVMDGEDTGEYETLSGDEEEAQGDALQSTSGRADAVQAQEQQLVLVTREGNMLLVVFGIIMLTLVGLVGVVVSWSSDGVASPLELPMFPPLLWLAIGVFTAASVEVLSASSTVQTGAAHLPPVLSDKAVFPHDQSDFDMIARQGNSPPRNPPATDDPRPPPPDAGAARRVVHHDDAEEKSSGPPPPPSAQESEDISAVVARAEELFEQNDHRQTHTLLQNALASHPTEIELLWRLARACNYLVSEASDPEQKKAMATEGLLYADKAYAINPNAACANKWKGILTSTMGNFRDLKEKIAGAFVIRDLIQRAIDLDPEDATCHNILGQWCLAFADMTWIEKRAASALFGTPPTATYDDAVAHFLNAERISPGFWKQNVFLLAQTYAKMKNEDHARVWLAKASQVPVKTNEDEDVEVQIALLSKKLRM